MDPELFDRKVVSGLGSVRLELNYFVRVFKTIGDDVNPKCAEEDDQIGGFKGTCQGWNATSTLWNICTRTGVTKGKRIQRDVYKCNEKQNEVVTHL